MKTSSLFAHLQTIWYGDADADADADDDDDGGGGNVSMPIIFGCASSVPIFPHTLML